jgi:hypothetical protein
MKKKEYFDVKLSLEQCAPSSLYDSMQGITYEKRIVIKRDCIDWSGGKWQIREGVYDAKNVQNITASIESYGFIHTEAPQVVIRSPQGHPTEFIGIVGFNRNEAQDNLNLETTMVDVVSFDTPLNLRAFSHKTNHDITPSAPCTQGDFVKSTNAAIDSGELAANEKDITEWLTSIIEPHRKSVLKACIKTIMNNIEYKNTLHRPLCGATANKLSKNLGISTGAGSYAFCKPRGESKTTFFDGMKSHLSSGQQISLYGYIEQPRPTTLASERKRWMRQFDNLGKFWQDLVESGSGMRPPLENCPFIFGGFLPQDETPDPSKGGSPTETELVFI